MAFSIGIPALYVVCSFSFFLSFWIDKFMFIHFYKTPPRHTSEMINQIVGIMRFSIIFHFILGYFMLQNSEILLNKESEGIFKKHESLKKFFAHDISVFLIAGGFILLLYFFS